MDDKIEEKVTLLNCEHNEMLVCDTIPDKIDLWRMSHESLDEDIEVCRPDWYEIPLSTLTEEIDIQEFKTDF